MNCEEVTEQLSAFALGALEPEEVEAIEAHLGGCRLHDGELVELRATVFAIDRYREELAPAPSLALTGRIRQLADGQTGDVQPEVEPAPPKPARRFGFPAVRRAFAGLAAAVVLFGAGWLAAGALSGGDDTYAVVLQDGAGATMEVSGVTAGDSVTVVMDGLARLPPESSYQVWAIRDDRWVPVGTCNTNADGWWHGDFDFGIEEGEKLALTIEPSGGSETPSGEPILRSAP